jgi:hypothetical protein
MNQVTETVSKSIRVIEHSDGGFVIRIGDEAMDALTSVFEAERAYSFPPAWATLLEYVIANDPRMVDYELDSEGRGWSATREPLDRLRAILLEAAAEPELLRKLIRDARAAAGGQGDL